MILIADSGSTKTDWALQSASGSWERFHTQGINPFHQDRAVIAGILRQELLPKLNPDEVSCVYFYGSGVRPELESVMTTLLQEAFPQAGQVEAHSDLLGAARGLCGHNYGIASILGTGANSCLYSGKAIIQNTPALGYILGDEGSGGVLGKHFLHELYKGVLSDNIRKEFESEFGLNMADVIQRVYREPMPNRFLGQTSQFCQHHRDNPEIHQFLLDCFTQFFVRNVKNYHRDDLPIHFVGSIAVVYEAELRAAAISLGLIVGRIIKAPLEGLIMYHHPDNHP